VAVIDHGRIIALDTPSRLIGDLGAESKVSFRIESGSLNAEEFEGLPAVRRVEEVGGGFTLYTGDSDSTLVDLVRLTDRRGFTLKNIRTEIPDLDDVFLTLTGRELRE
jgi:ABC-2 type transport system ATP-binding protein